MLVAELLLLVGIQYLVNGVEEKILYHLFYLYAYLQHPALLRKAARHGFMSAAAAYIRKRGRRYLSRIKLVQL